MTRFVCGGDDDPTSIGCKRTLVSGERAAKATAISGVAGHILFLYEYYKFCEDPLVELAVQQRFSWLEEQLSSLHYDSSFSYGLTGIGWVYEYLLESLEPDYNGTFNHSTDMWLYNNFLSQPWQVEIEYIHGLAGLAPYIARRAKYVPEHPMIGCFLDQIERLAEKTKFGIKWPTPPIRHTIC